MAAVRNKTQNLIALVIVDSPAFDYKSIWLAYSKAPRKNLQLLGGVI
jgi:hypothetical protein